MPGGKRKQPTVTQRQIAENATKVACEPYYSLYAGGNTETRLHLVTDLAIKLNPEGVASETWRKVGITAPAKHIWQLIIVPQKVERHLRAYAIEATTGYRLLNLRKYTGLAAFGRLYAVQITEETKRSVQPGNKHYLATWNKTRDMMYERLKSTMPEEYAKLDEVAQQWEDLGTPLEIAQENRRKGAGPFINKIIEYMDKRFAMTVVMMTGCLNVETSQPEVAMYVPIPLLPPTHDSFPYGIDMNVLARVIDMIFRTSVKRLSFETSPYTSITGEHIHT